MMESAILAAQATAVTQQHARMTAETVFERVWGRFADSYRRATGGKQVVPQFVTTMFVVLRVVSYNTIEFNST